MILPDGPVAISGDGIVLREWTLDDIPAMSELFDEQSIDDWTPLESPFDGDAARRYLDRGFANQAKSLGIQLAITTDGAAPLGEVLLFDTGTPGTAELAYAVGLKFRGSRLGARAVRLLVGFAEQACGITAFQLRISTDNLASQSVARDAGFTLTEEPLVLRERKGRRLQMATWRR